MSECVTCGSVAVVTVTSRDGLGRRWARTPLCESCAGTMIDAIEAGRLAVNGSVHVPPCRGELDFTAYGCARAVKIYRNVRPVFGGMEIGEA